MKQLLSFKQLTALERILWLGSVTVVSLAFLAMPTKDYLSLTASLIGVTALIFVAKGMVIGQVLTVVFAVFYGIISFYFRYYGEMLTYLCMTSPIAVLAALEWRRNPYRDTAQVRVRKLDARSATLMLALATAATVASYFVLHALDTANLTLSTVSVTTSFIASYLTFLRSPYYALGYAANDLVLIGLWMLAAFEDPAYAPMIACFAMFFVNDAYGFINWRRMRLSQAE